MEGVNAYINEVNQAPNNLPIEFKLLNITPKAWTPEVVISRHQGLLGNITQELNLARAVAKVGEKKVKEIETNFTYAKTVEGIKKEYEPAPVKTAPRIVRPSAPSTAEMPLNKFVAHCGVCSRRDAVTLIKEGKIKVNNAVVIQK